MKLRNGIFHRLFQKLIEEAIFAAGKTREAVANPVNFEEMSILIKDLERKADITVHEIVTTFRERYTPHRFEDIRGLAHKIDDIIDGLERTTNRISIFMLSDKLPEETLEFIKVIEHAVKEIKEALICLSKGEKQRLLDHCIEINRLENEGDKILRSSLRKLMNPPNDSSPCLEIMKSKEIIETLEKTTDSCEDVAGILESMID